MGVTKRVVIGQTISNNLSPLPVESWSHELPATKIQESCLRDFAPYMNRPVVGSEDCLHLNVYVPLPKKSNDSLPVIFYIYGGAFRGGATVDGHERYIIDYDVIFVSANYRTGSLGFLSTEDNVVPGNMGLKDQSTALRWTYDNIESFGGDRNKITLFGGSSGGISVHYHYLSPWSRGLFHAGVSLSGTAFVPTAVKKRSRENAIRLGRLVNCTDADVNRMVECLRRIPAEKLVAAQNQMQVWRDLPMLFGPVIEKSSVDPFVNDYPSRILREGGAHDVPWITGVVSEEGLVFTGYFTRNDILKYIDENWDSLAPTLLQYSHTIPEEEHVSVARKIRKHYFGEKPIDRENLHALTKLVGDRMFSVGAVNAAKAQAVANKSPVYFYYYAYRATDSLSGTENLGVSHSDDVYLVIRDPRMTPAKSPKDMAMHRHLMRMLTSVAHNGVPEMDVEWPNVSSENTTSLHYLHLAGPDDLKAECSDDLAQNQFWYSIGFDEK